MQKIPDTEATKHHGVPLGHAHLAELPENVLLDAKALAIIMFGESSRPRMLVIRNQQMNVFGEARKRSFQEKLYLRLLTLPGNLEQQYGQAVLMHQIDAGIERAAQFLLRSEADVARYIEIAFQYLGGFTEQPHAKEALNILYRHGAASSERLDCLEAWCRQTNGRSAAR